MIREQTGFEAETVPAATGQFDVLADGALIFSKAEAGRFPEESEVLRLL